MINQEVFTKVINALREQYDKDVERANVLSEVYGSDIDPADNSLLSESIFLLLFKEMHLSLVEEVKHFCYVQNFGRKNGQSITDLWRLILAKIEVNEPYTLETFSVVEEDKPYQNILDEFRKWNTAWNHYDNASAAERPGVEQPKSDFEFLKQLKGKYNIVKR